MSSRCQTSKIGPGCYCLRPHSPFILCGWVDRVHIEIVHASLTNSELEISPLGASQDLRGCISARNRWKCSSPLFSDNLNSWFPLDLPKPRLGWISRLMIIVVYNDARQTHKFATWCFSSGHDIIQFRFPIRSESFHIFYPVAEQTGDAT